MDDADHTARDWATDECKLKAAADHPGVPCDGPACVYWRAIEHLGVDGDGESGCAIQHFRLLDGGEPVAEWLLSVKLRIEGPFDS